MASAGLAHSKNFVDFSEADQMSLKGGGIVVWTDRLSSGASGQTRQFVDAAILLDAPLDQVWALIDDKEEIPEVIESVITAKIVSRQGNVTVIAQTVRSAFWRTASYVVRHEGLYPVWVDFERVRGDFKHIEGSWMFEEVQDSKSNSKTLLTYHLHLDAGGLVPQGWVMKSQLNKLPRIMTRIKGQLATEQAKKAFRQQTPRSKPFT